MNIKMASVFNTYCRHVPRLGGSYTVPLGDIQSTNFWRGDERLIGQL